nr:MAG TPA: hypothetical protein [Caudoviricetes sp.]
MAFPLMGFFGCLFDAMVNGRDYLSRMLIAFFKTSMASLASRNSRFKRAISLASSDA